MASLVWNAQARESQVAWISLPGRCFFPPDFAAVGVDPNALPVVRAPDLMKAARAADTLLRCGSFALVVLDANAQALPLAMQNRLAGLAHQFNTALVCLRSPGEEITKGSLVSLRCASGMKRVGHDTFQCELRAMKDKRIAAGWGHKEYRNGPDGLS